MYGLKKSLLIFLIMRLEVGDPKMPKHSLQKMDIFGTLYILKIHNSFVTSSCNSIDLLLRRTLQGSVSNRLLELSVQAQLFNRIPKFFLKVYHLVVFNFYTFFFKQFLHLFRIIKMYSSTKQALPIYYPLRRHFGFHSMTSIHSPAYHSCRRFSAQRSRNSTIRSNSSFWNLPDNIINQLKKIIVFFS